MAVLNRVQELKEDFFDQLVIAQVSSMLKDLREEIPVGTVIHDYPCVVVVLDDAMKSHDAWMRGRELMQSYLPDMQLPLASCVAFRRVRQALDCV